MRKLAQLNRTLFADRGLVSAMIGVASRCAMVLVCAGVSIGLNVTDDDTDDDLLDFSSEEDFLNFTIPRYNYTDISNLNENKNVTGDSDDLQLEGSQRFVSPVAYSYATTTEPRPVGGEKKNFRRTVSYYQPPTPVAYRHRPYQAYAEPRSIVPLLHYTQERPTTTVESEKQEIVEHDPEEGPIQRVEEDEEDDGGGGEDYRENEEESASDDEELRNASEEDEDESEVGDEPEDNEERGESRDTVVETENPPKKVIEFDEEYGPKEEVEPHEEEQPQGKAREYVSESGSKPLKRPKKHQKVEDGLDKVLLAPVKFAYNEDSSPSASGHKKHHQGKIEKGGGEAHDSDHHATHGKKGEKGYKGYHKFDKGQKGHHDKEAHEKEFSDHKGKKAKLKDTGGHYGAHHKEHKGKKGALYGEKGEHKKGHSTKGEHKIHKKDEYVKKHEFYDEHHEGGEHEKHGGYHEGHQKKHGGKHKSGHKKAGYHDDHHGKKGHHQKGGHHDEHKGHKEAEGHEEHHAHKETYGKKEGEKKGKKWGFDKKQ